MKEFDEDVSQRFKNALDAAEKIATIPDYFIFQLFRFSASSSFWETISSVKSSSVNSQLSSAITLDYENPSSLLLLSSV